MDYIKLLNDNAGVLSLLFSGIVMVATVVYALLTATLVRETRQMREAQTEPRIEVAIAPKEEYVNIVTLRVKNIGLGPAYDVRFDLRGEEDSDGEKELIADFSKTQFLRRGLRYLGPGQELRSSYTQMTKNFEVKIRSRITVSVSYQSATEKQYSEEVPIWFEELEGYGRIGTPHLYSIAKSLEKIERNVDHLSSGFRRLRVDVFSEQDRERESAQWERTQEELLKEPSPEEEAKPCDQSGT